MTSAQRDGLKDAALALTEPMIDDLVKDISHRIRDAGAITDTAEYQIYRAQALGASKKEVERRVAEQLNLQDEVISSLFEYVLDKSLAYEDNGSLQQMANAYAEMTKSKTAEMLQTLWGTAPDGQVLPLQDAYARALDFAFRETATGGLDMETAIRRAVTPLAKRGLRTIEQKSGRSIGIEYACRRYIMDQLGALDDEVQKANHDTLGCDGWEISAHAACAPDHEPIQGRQYSDAEYEQLNNSLQRRIGHLNCGHTASPIILGVNAPQYTETELKQFAADNEKGITYNGKHYTLYQRHLRRRHHRAPARPDAKAVHHQPQRGAGEQGRGPGPAGPGRRRQAHRPRQRRRRHDPVDDGAGRGQRVLCELYGGVICRPKSTSASPCAAARPMTSSRSFPPPWCRYTTLPVSDGDC